MLQIVLRMPVLADVLTNLDLTPDFCPDADQGLRLIMSLKEIVREWAGSHSVSSHPVEVIKSLGHPFDGFTANTGIGQQHCAMDALMRLLQTLEDGLLHFPAVSLAAYPVCILQAVIANFLPPSTQHICLCMLQRYRILNSIIGCHVLKFKISDDGKVVRLPDDEGLCKMLDLDVSEGMESVYDALDVYCYGHANADAPRAVCQLGGALQTIFLNLPRVGHVSITCSCFCELLALLHYY